MLLRLTLTSLLLGSTAFAADVRFNVNFGNWRVGNVRQSRAYVPYGYPVAPYWVVYTVPAVPAPPPQVIYVEREPEREPPPAPQVVVVQLPPVAPPAPAVVPQPPPAPTVPAAALPPRVPGPDVFSWTDEDGVVHYSTRVPAEARKRAKKLSTLGK